MGVKEAMASVGRAYETWKSWRKDDAVFKAAADKISGDLKAGRRSSSEGPDFPEFCDTYLPQPLPLHHVRAWDVVNGREPRDLHPSMVYQPGAADPEDQTVQVIMNFPPEHAKSTVWGV